MSQSDYFNAALLDLIFLGSAIATIADDALDYPATEYYLSLHEADPTPSGNQSSFEASYGDYARIPITRDGAGFVRTDNVVNFFADMLFPAVGSGSGVYTHFGLGKDSVGAGELLYSGPITPNITVGVGQQPKLTTDTAIQFVPYGE
jgi:hypothetical protein